MELLKSYKEIVDKHILETTSQVKHPIIKESAEYFFKTGGKRLRPALLIATYQALNGTDLELAGKLSAAIEIIHNWSLVHDDIMDASEKRRGHPTVHIKWDEDTAILSGDALNNLAYRTILDTDLSKEKLESILDALSLTTLELIDGQMDDVGFEKRNDITEPEYMQMIKGKTGSLIKHAVKIGAILGTDNQEQINLLSEYGEIIGVAFQIQDDILDLEGGDAFGKEIGKDIKEGKRTIIAIHAFNSANEEQAEKLNYFLGNKELSKEEIQDSINLLNEIGSIQYARDKMNSMIQDAKNKIDFLEESEYKKALKELADFCVERTI